MDYAYLIKIVGKHRFKSGFAFLRSFYKLWMHIRSVYYRPVRKSQIPADSIIIAISQVPQDNLHKDVELKKNQRGTLETNEHGETTMPGVFASGDVVTGAKTVVAAVAVSKQIAEDMDKYMQSLK